MVTADPVVDVVVFASLVFLMAAALVDAAWLISVYGAWRHRRERERER